MFAGKQWKWMLGSLYFFESHKNMQQVSSPGRVHKSPWLPFQLVRNIEVYLKGFVMSKSYVAEIRKSSYGLHKAMLMIIYFIELYPIIQHATIIMQCMMTNFDD